MAKKQTTRPENFQPEAREAEMESQRHKRERPSVTPENTRRYSNVDKKYQSEFGVGAKLAPIGSDLRARQDAAAKAKIEEYKAKNDHYPVEDVNRPVTKGGVDINRIGMQNRTIDYLSKKK